MCLFGLISFFDSRKMSSGDKKMFSEKKKMFSEKD